MHGKLKIASNSYHSLLATDGFSMAHYEGGGRRLNKMNSPRLCACVRGALLQLLCSVLLQLTARLDLLEERPGFETPPSLEDDFPAFSPQHSASFSPPSLRGPTFNSLLSPSDHFLAPHADTEEPEQCFNSEAGTGALDEPAETPMSFEDIGDINMIKVKQ